MSNLVDYAKEELKRIGMIDSGEPYNDAVAKAILDLIELFASQGHSGFTAPYTVNAFKRLAMFKPLSPLTGEDSEWNEIEPGFYQNKRYSSVFKKDGKVYDCDGKIFTDDGEVWYSNKDSRIEIVFPYIVPDKPEKVYLNKIQNDESGVFYIPDDENKMVGAHHILQRIFDVLDKKRLNRKGVVTNDKRSD